MSRKAIEIILTKEQKAQLEKMTLSHKCYVCPYLIPKYYFNPDVIQGLWL